ncbi:MAG: hypothetical protein GX639_04120 [Fibrobacter sp.]|nr:hypothetical protein [Fibrobacter sp.]
MIHKIYWGIAVILIAGGIYCSQTYLSKNTDPGWKTESFSYLPDNERIKDVLLGYETTVSHYLWIRSVIYFGEHYKGDKRYLWIVNMLDIITKLNPLFYPAYEFAGVLLPDITTNPDIPRILLERGLTKLNNRQWNIAFYTGMLYYQKYSDTYTAAKYFEMASRFNSPHKAKYATLAAAFYKKSGLEKDGLNFLLFMYETSDNPEVKRHLKEKIEHYVKK